MESDGRVGEVVRRVIVIDRLFDKLSGSHLRFLTPQMIGCQHASH